MSDSAKPLLEGQAAETCRACVTIPARNEAAMLPRCLNALADQVDLDGSRLPPSSFEVLLLLNNCTDGSAGVARRWQAEHPQMPLHIAERTLTPEQAHAGTARQLLMDTALHRLRSAQPPTAILSTDADTVVAPDWIAQNLRTLSSGADLVGGLVEVLPEELQSLSPWIEACYRQDRRYARLVAQLEDLLDPRPGDPWPRHLDHFGSSLACTPAAYARAGGMPAVTPLEDEAFVDRARHADLVLRHEPAVRVFTSARLEGRTSVGMAAQFRLWGCLSHAAAHKVSSAEFLEHRFRMLRRLRHIYATKDIGDLALPTKWWKQTFRDALQNEATCPAFLGAVYCDILIAESFREEREQPIQQALEELQQMVCSADSLHKAPRLEAPPALDLRLRSHGRKASALQSAL